MSDTTIRVWEVLARPVTRALVVIKDPVIWTSEPEAYNKFDLTPVTSLPFPIIKADGLVKGIL